MIFSPLPYSFAYDCSPDMVGTAADALFPLILCEPRLYQVLLKLFVWSDI